jgi:hypothetical protein
MRKDVRRLGKKVQNNPYNHDLKRNYRLFLWEPIKGKVIYNIQGHNSHMYDTTPVIINNKLSVYYIYH